MIRLEGVTRRYVEAGERHVILDGVDVRFAPGRFTALVGKSGSGKTTVLNLISGIDLPDAGRVYVGDRDVTAMGDRDRTLFRRDHLGIVFQFFNLIPTLTVLENVTLPSELAGRAGGGRAMELLERVGLADRRDAMPDRLSGGEQQRVAIARALAHDPDVVLADEPTGNLDEETGEAVLRLLLETTREAGKTLIMATHGMDVLPLADAVFTIHGGRLVGLGG